MMMSRKTLLGACLLATVFVTTGTAQQAAPPAPPKLMTFKVDVMLTRLQGEKVLGTSPFSVLVSGVNNIARLRIGVEVPSGTVTPKDNTGRTETAFKTVGTQIDAYVTSSVPNEGRYPLQLSISDTAVFSDDNADRVARAELAREGAAKALARQRDLFGKRLTTGQAVDQATDKLRAAELEVSAARSKSVMPAHADQTAFRSFTYSNVLYLHDGQTEETIVATDRTSGETVKASVTLTIVK